MDDSRSIVWIELPSGGWWEINTRPLWEHVRYWIALAEGPGDDDLVAHMLTTLTESWSFRDQVSPDSVARRDPGDLEAVLEVFHRTVVPYLRRPGRREMAEELFTGLLTGKVPPSFVDAWLMDVTGWSWHVLQDTPAEVVDRVMVYAAVKQARAAGDALDFPETEG